MEKIENSLNWFEIPVKNFERARKFYSSIYSFEMPEMEMGPVKMGFFLVETGKIGGAICFGEGYEPSENGALVYLNGGSDLNNVLKKVEQAGGRIMLPKTFIREDLGYYAIMKDSEGNRVALHSMK